MSLSGSSPRIRTSVQKEKKTVTQGMTNVLILTQESATLTMVQVKGKGNGPM